MGTLRRGGRGSGVGEIGGGADHDGGGGIGGEESSGVKTTDYQQ